MNSSLIFAMVLAFLIIVILALYVYRIVKNQKGKAGLAGKIGETLAAATKGQKGIPQGRELMFWSAGFPAWVGILVMLGATALFLVIIYYQKQSGRSSTSLVSLILMVLSLVMTLVQMAIRKKYCVLTDMGLFVCQGQAPKGQERPPAGYVREFLWSDVGAYRIRGTRISYHDMYRDRTPEFVLRGKPSLFEKREVWKTLKFSTATQAMHAARIFEQKGVTRRFH